MTIAVHILLPAQKADTEMNFNLQCFTLLAIKHPSDHFIFIFDKPFDAAAIKAGNVTPVLLSPAIKNRLTEHYFYNFKIPAILKTYRAGCFISSGVCSLRTMVPQYLILQDLSFLQKENMLSRPALRYMKKFMPSFIKKAAKIAVRSSYLKEAIEKTYAVPPDKITILRQAIAERYRPLLPKKSAAAIEQIAEGKQFFLFFATGASISNLVLLLKSFSIFKKWQKSNMLLIIAYSVPLPEKFMKELTSYKYRNDVKLEDNINSSADPDVLGAAYAAFHLTSMEIMEDEGLYAIACGVPLITIESNFTKCRYEDAALYTSLSEKNIADKMMSIYKDETTRNNLVAAGTRLIISHTPDRVSNELWDGLQTISN